MGEGAHWKFAETPHGLGGRYISRLEITFDLVMIVSFNCLKACTVMPLEHILEQIFNTSNKSAELYVDM